MVRNLYPPNRYSLPPSKTNTSYKAWWNAVQWLRMSRWVGAAKSSDASQPVNLYSANHRLTRKWYVPLSLANTWLVPLSVCDHSQGIYFTSNHKKLSVVLRVLFQQTNKQTSKQANKWRFLEKDLRATRGRASGKNKNKQHTRPSKKIMGRPEKSATRT